MALSTKNYDLTGNQMFNDGITLQWDAMTNTVIPAGLGVSISTGTGAPTFAASAGSLYIRRDGGVNTRLYINTTGASTWTPMTNAA